MAAGAMLSTSHSQPSAQSQIVAQSNLSSVQALNFQSPHYPPAPRLQLNSCIQPNPELQSVSGAQPDFHLQPATFEISPIFSITNDI